MGSDLPGSPVLDSWLGSPAAWDLYFDKAKPLGSFTTGVLFVFKINDNDQEILAVVLKIKDLRYAYINTPYSKISGSSWLCLNL